MTNEESMVCLMFDFVVLLGLTWCLGVCARILLGELVTSVLSMEKEREKDPLRKEREFDWSLLNGQYVEYFLESRHLIASRH